jgi:phosphatidylglycerol lysyltransferase
MRQESLDRLSPFLGLLLFVSALWILRHELHGHDYHAIVQQVEALPFPRLALALLFTVLSYLTLTSYDALALRYISHPLGYGKTALASFIGYAISNNIGFSWLSSVPVRYRLYSAWGLSALEVAKVSVFSSLTLWLGVLALGGIVFLTKPLEIPAPLLLPFISSRLLGTLCVILVAVYLSLSLLKKTPFRVGEWEFSFPSFGLSLAQILCASLDWILAGSVLYVLLPSVPALSYAKFLAIFLLAQLAGVVSQVPGGLGVFETVMLLLLSPVLSSPVLLGSLLAYRGIYYLLPLGVAAMLLGTHELLQRKAGVSRAARLLSQWGPQLVPSVLSLTTFISGALLLFSGATPAVQSRLAWLKEILPLPILEISHFLGSLAGIGLVLLARGLQQRLDAAYHFTVALLSAGIVFSLLKGFDYEEATILAVMLTALLPCRQHFYRKTSLINERFTPHWIVAIVFALLGSVWLGIFSYKHVEYAHDLWWQFAFSEDAPRFLRATVGVLSTTLIFALARLLRPSPAKLSPPTQNDQDKVRAIIATSRTTAANLALLGDKALLFSESDRAFIMYGIEGRSWVALGDPIGPDDEIADLLWQFRELCDRHDGWPVFYEVGLKNLPLYLDLGLTLLKLGEEARVRLDSFSLKGETRRGLRYTVNKMEKEGCTFAVIPAKEVPSLLPELRAVSDAWLEEKHTREKGFSLGFFDATYLQQFPAAVVLNRTGQIVAFANIWLGAEHEELSLDLMRHLPEAPPSVMEYLFIKIMLWGQQEGYHWFNLGMAPLSGLENRALAPLWNRLGALLFQHGEHFYNFQGLRHYKEKFDPEWSPKYLASPGGLALPRILTNLASLIAGGLKGIVSK